MTTFPEQPCTTLLSPHHCPYENVEEDEHNVDYYRYGDVVCGHEHLVSDLLVDETSLQLLPHGTARDLGLDALKEGIERDGKISSESLRKL